MAENSRTPPGKVERGRDRGARGPYARRPTLLHTQPQEDMDDISRYALVTARRETLLIKTAQLCQERWASTRTIPGYGTPPPAAAQERQPEDVTGALERSFPPESLSFSARQAPPPSKTKARSTTAHQLQMEDQPSPPEEDHQLHTDYSRLPTHAGSSSDAGLDTEEVRSLGSRNVNPDQLTRDPSANQGALPSPEAEAITIPPSNLGPLDQESVHTTENRDTPHPTECLYRASDPNGQD